MVRPLPGGAAAPKFDAMSEPLSPNPAAAEAAAPPWRRMAFEVGPLVVFFVANQTSGIMVATALFMAAAVIAVGLSWRMERRVPLMPLISAAFVVLFGGLTLALDDDLFIKIKPTVVNLLFAGAILVGLALRQDILKIVIGGVMHLTDRGWRILSIRWAVFFVFLAIVNEVVWRNFSTEFWAGFKLFGIFPMTLAFGLAQIPLALRYAPPEAAGEADAGEPEPGGDPESRP